MENPSRKKTEYQLKNLRKKTRPWCGDEKSSGIVYKVVQGVVQGSTKGLQTMDDLFVLPLSKGTKPSH